MPGCIIEAVILTGCIGAILPAIPIHRTPGLRNPWSSRAPIGDDQAIVSEPVFTNGVIEEISTDEAKVRVNPGLDMQGHLDRIQPQLDISANHR